jgi:kumamolisin
VISISLGECEPDLTGYFGPVRQLNRLFGAASAAGVSIFVSAGDQGSSACSRPPVALDLLAVSNPADSHYVTAVGGTNVTLDDVNEITDQVVWNDSPNLFAGGGGGLSILFDRPWWQGVAKRFGGDARTVPDITALADVTPGYVLYCTADPCREFPQTTPGWVSVGGTSAAAPLMASGIALANDAARRQGREAVGLINPLIYGLGGGSRAKAIADVVTGDNDLGLMLTPPNGDPPHPLGCCHAKRGYDAASGLGSLRIQGFSKVAQKAARP